MDQKKNKTFISIGVWIGVAVLFHLLGWYMNQSAALYTIYFNNVYLPIAQIKSFVFGVWPFSVGDLLYLGLIIWTLFLLGNFIKTSIRKSDISYALLRIIRFLAASYIVFLVSWGYNYQKPNVLFPQQAQGESLVATTLIDDVLLLDTLINQINLLRPQIDWLTTDQEYAVAAVNAYQAYNEVFHVDPLKFSLLGRHIYKLGVSGYFNPFTGEGHMVPDLPQSTYGFVYLHEMAHQVGVASESEANLVAYMIAMHSDEPVFHYTALLQLYRQFYRQIYMQDQIIAKRMAERLITEVVSDLESSKNYALTHQFSIRKYSMSVYEQYLKQLGHEDGLSAYGKLLQQVRYCDRKNIQLEDILWQYYN